MEFNEHLDPDVAALLEASPFGSFDFGDLDPSMVTTVRELMPALFSAPPSSVVHQDEVTSPERGHPVPLVVSRPPTDRPARGCVVWIHGGGFMLGSARADQAEIDRWVERFDCVVVSVDYRLAPEHPYPTPLEDCAAGLTWTIGHADRLGIDPARLVIAGASAGAALAAGLTLLRRDRGDTTVALQLLVYPMLDHRHESVSCGIASPLWPERASRLAWASYLGGNAEPAAVPAYAAPARADDLTGLPPTFITVGNLDIVRDEAIRFGLRLLEAGVPTELHVYPGLPHAADLFAAGAPVVTRFRRDIDQALAAVLELTPD